MAKLIMYDWRCKSCDTKYEALAPMSQLEGECPECGSESKRLITGTRIDPKLGVDPDGFPTMGDKWANKMERRAKEAKKRQLEHGDDI